MIDKNKIPEHLAIIMDGNGRWAQRKGLPRIQGHRAGVKTVEEVVKGCLDLGIKILSLYTFSTENWRRPKSEIRALMSLLQLGLNNFYKKMQKNKIRFLCSGKLVDLPMSLQQVIRKMTKLTEGNDRLTLNLAINYGAREEILQATRMIASKVRRRELDIDQINEELFASHLYTKGLPDPDFLIRTSNERRVSNFFLWQICYSELYFTTKLWPDFKQRDLEEAILDYQERQRRFGSH